VGSSKQADYSDAGQESERLAGLVEALGDVEPATRLAAERDLLAAGPAAAAPLLDVFDGRTHLPYEVRAAAPRLLPRLGPAALPANAKAGNRDADGGSQMPCGMPPFRPPSTWGPLLLSLSQEC
jgi:hypothetical protein